MNGLEQLRTAKTISNIRGEEVSGPSYMNNSSASTSVPVEPAETTV
jgi:hypothetical protein